MRLGSLPLMNSFKNEAAIMPMLPWGFFIFFRLMHCSANLLSLSTFAVFPCSCDKVDYKQEFTLSFIFTW